ncbi:hypothetical protein MMPV_003266 [Pyropia vietnamensis]
MRLQVAAWVGWASCGGGRAAPATPQSRTAAVAPATVAPPPGCDGRRTQPTAPTCNAATHSGRGGSTLSASGATCAGPGSSRQVAAVAAAVTVAVVVPAGNGGGDNGGGISSSGGVDSSSGGSSSGGGSIGGDGSGGLDRGARGDPSGVVVGAAGVGGAARAVPTRVTAPPRQRSMLRQLANEAVRASGRVEIALKQSGVLFASRGDPSGSAAGAVEGRGAAAASSAGRTPNGHGGSGGGGGGSGSSSSGSSSRNRRNGAPGAAAVGNHRRRSGQERRRQSPPAAPPWNVPPTDVEAVERALAAVTPEELCVMPTDYMPTTPTDRWAGGDSDSGDEGGVPTPEAAPTGGGGDAAGDGAADTRGEIGDRGRGGHAVSETVPPAAGSSRSGSPPPPADDDANAIIHIPVSAGRLVNMSVFILPAGTAIPLHDHPGMTVVTKVLWGTLHVESYDLVRPEGSASGWLTPSGGDVARAGPDDEAANGWHAGANGRTLSAADGGGNPPAPSPFVSPVVCPPHISVPLPPGLAVAHPPQTLVGGDIRTLGPAGGGNIHQFRASSAGRCALLDVSLPPYNFAGGRGVHYFAPAEPLDADTAASLVAAGVVPPPGVTFVTLTEVPSPPTYRTVDAVYYGPTVTVI